MSSNDAQKTHARISALLGRKEVEMRAALMDAVEMIDEGRFEDEEMDAKLATIESCRRTRREYVAALDLLYRPR